MIIYRELELIFVTKNLISSLDTKLDFLITLLTYTEILLFTVGENEWDYLTIKSLKIN